MPRALPWVTVRSRNRRSAGSIASRGGFTEGWEHMRVEIPVSLGELVDKITILQIKSTRLVEPDAKANVRRELEALELVLTGLGLAPEPLGKLRCELETINAELWDLEDTIRVCEREQDFGERFIDLARRVYRSNDRRAQIKRDINGRFGSEFVEEKSYGDTGASS